MTKNVPRGRIRSTNGYFRAIEALDRLEKTRRQQRARLDEDAAHVGFLRPMDFESVSTQGWGDDGSIDSLEKRIFTYLDSLSDDERYLLRKSSRKWTHRGLLDEYEWQKEQEAWRKGMWGGSNDMQRQRQRERGRVLGQKVSTQLMLDCLPTTDRASELLMRLKQVGKFLSWSAEPAEDPNDEGERIDAFVEAVWGAQSGYRHIFGFDAHCRAFEQLRQRHFFPDLIELIGRPALLHHQADGALTTERKRQLLLLGTFSWRGMVLTYERLWSPDGWRLKKGFQWRVATTCHWPRARTFMTLADVLPQPQAYEWDDFEKICQAWRIRKETKAGKGLPRTPRTLQCEHCQNWVFSDASRRLNLGGVPRRYCLSCYRTLKMARALKRLDREKNPSTTLNGRKKFWE
ncbi:hypothetical protein [Burkholderia ubonensis]|uniref:hypothetical protein n=1 Tax=Burkholderia ubonensis TaxID=101571 RepID=UPI000B229053|nr:hypothetical protein [Burkholderia ubonensis]